MKKNCSWHELLNYRTIRGKIFLEMKLVGILICIVGLTGSFASGYSQQAKLNVNVQNMTVKDVLKQIEDQSGYAFMYNASRIDIYRTIDLHVEERSVEDILKMIFAGDDVSYKVMDRHIIIISNSELKETESAQQIRPVSGKVIDSSGLPLPGVTVVIKGSTKGTITGSDGKFILADVPEDALLQFSFVGMKQEEIPVSGKATINVTLFENIARIDEVLVTGYSTQKKKDITGSVGVVDVATIQSIPTGSAIQALQGQVSGVNVVTSGEPGAESNIFIRGISTFGNTQPLVLIDGVEGDLDAVNPNDVESMQVLKDAGAAAIYGVRGSNGVIIVTTKKGKPGEPVVTYSGYIGKQLPLSGNPYDIMNSEEYFKVQKARYPNDALYAGNALPDFTYGSTNVRGFGNTGDPAVDPLRYRFDPEDHFNDYFIIPVDKSGTNWFQEIFRPAVMQQHNVSVSGASDKFNYMFSLNYVNQEGTLIETYDKRYSVRVNTRYKISDGIRMGENVYVYYNQNPGLENRNTHWNAIAQTYRQDPTVPVYDIAGNFTGTRGMTAIQGQSQQNPVAKMMRTANNRGNYWNITGNVYAEIDFLHDFNLRSSIGGSTSYRYGVDYYFNRYEDRQEFAGKNRLTESSSYNSNIISTTTLKYSKVIGIHNLNVIGGVEANKYLGRSMLGASSDFFSDDFNYLVLDNGSADITTSSYAYHNNLFSIFGRLDYVAHDKYLLAATIRRDGSSRFGKEVRYGTFPSASLGWRISNEGFMKGVSWLSDLKVRASYGKLGSQNNIDPDNAFSLFGVFNQSSTYAIDGSNNIARQGFRQSRIGNESTGWEEDIISNAGFDAGLFDNKLTISAEYYKKSIKGLLFPIPLPATAGTATPPSVNIGDIQNEGVDLSLTYRGNIGRDMTFKVTTNVTTYKNLVKSIPDPGYFDVTTDPVTVVRNQVGHPVSSFFGYDIAGIFQSDEDVAASPAQQFAAPGRFKYRDISGPEGVPDGKITSDDRTFIGDPNPDFTYGLNLDLGFKQFDFSAIFYGSQGNEAYNATKQKANKMWLNAWTPDNKNTNIPRNEAIEAQLTPNSFPIEDASYLKLRSVMLGYTLKPLLTKKAGIEKVKLYVQATNLFQVTNYSGLDPELPGSSSNFGLEFGNYPNNQRSFILGVDVTF